MPRFIRLIRYPEIGQLFKNYIVPLLTLLRAAITEKIARSLPWKSNAPNPVFCTITAKWRGIVFLIAESLRLTSTVLNVLGNIRKRS